MVTNMIEFCLKLRLVAAIVQLMKGFFHKHNGLLAGVLSLVLVISGSLQLVHDQLLDHQHNSDCAMYTLDGNTPIAGQQSACLTQKQQIEAEPLSPIQLVLTQVEQHKARAPPVSL